MISRDGNITDVINNDTLRRYGITKKQIIQKLQAIINIYTSTRLTRSTHNPFQNDVKFENFTMKRVARRELTTFKTCCPVNSCNHDDGSCTEYLIYNSKQSLRFTNNLIHMITHGIFSDVFIGRISPESLIEILDMKSGINSSDGTPVDYSSKIGGTYQYPEFDEMEINQYELSDCMKYFKRASYKTEEAHIRVYDMNSNAVQKKKLGYRCDYKIFVTDCKKIPMRIISFKYKQFKFHMLHQEYQKNVTMKECQIYHS